MEGYAAADITATADAAADATTDATADAAEERRSRFRQQILIHLPTKPKNQQSRLRWEEFSSAVLWFQSMLAPSKVDIPKPGSKFDHSQITSIGLEELGALGEGGE